MSIIYGGVGGSHAATVKPRPRSVRNQYEKKQRERSGVPYKQVERNKMKSKSGTKLNIWCRGQGWLVKLVV